MSINTPRDEVAILAELTPIFRAIFKNDRLMISSATTAADVTGWDSLTHVELIVAVEKRYKMNLKLADVLRFKNVGDLCRTVLKYGR